MTLYVPVYVAFNATTSWPIKRIRNDWRCR